MQTPYRGGARKEGRRTCRTQKERRARQWDCEPKKKEAADEKRKAHVLIVWSLVTIPPFTASLLD